MTVTVLETPVVSDPTDTTVNTATAANAPLRLMTAPVVAVAAATQRMISVDDWDPELATGLCFYFYDENGLFVDARTEVIDENTADSWQWLIELAKFDQTCSGEVMTLAAWRGRDKTWYAGTGTREH